MVVVLTLLAEAALASGIAEPGLVSAQQLADLVVPSSAEMGAAAAAAMNSTNSFSTPVDPVSATGTPPTPADARQPAPVPHLELDPTLLPVPTTKPGPQATTSRIAPPKPPSAAAQPSAAAFTGDGFVEGESKVIEGTPTSLTYRNPDGTQTKEVYSEPAAFVDPETKTWTKFDPTPELLPDGRLGPAAAATPVSFAAAADDDQLLELGNAAGRTISFELLGAAASPVEVEGNSVLYRDVFPDTDLKENAYLGGVKEEIVVKSLPNQAPTYRFKMTISPGLTPRTGEDGAIEVVDASGIVTFVVPAGVAWEQNPALPPVPVAMSLASDGPAWFVDLTPDWAWMSDPARSFPLTIDPQVTAPTAAGAGAYDLYIVDAIPNGYYDNGIDRYGWSRPNASVQNYYQTHMRFGDVGIPAGAVLVNATLQLAVAQTTFYFNSGAWWQGGGASSRIVRVIRNWEGGAVTYNNRPGAYNATTNPSSLAGVDWASAKDVWTNPGQLNFDVTDYVAAWRAGAPNWGIALLPSTGPVWLDGPGSPPTALIDIASLESGLPPFLRVTYSTAPTSTRDDNALLQSLTMAYSRSAMLSWVDEDATVPGVTYRICTNTNGVCTPAATYFDGTRVKTTFDFLPALQAGANNGSSNNLVYWYVEKTYPGGPPVASGWNLETFTVWYGSNIAPTGSFHRQANAQIQITWTDPDIAAGYTKNSVVDLCKDASCSTVYETTGQTTGTSVTATTLAAGFDANKLIYVRVRSRLFNAGGSSNAAFGAGFTLTNTQPPPVAIPGLGTDGFVTTNSPTLTINKVTDPEADPVTYKFRICDAPNGGGSCLSGSQTPPATQAQITWSVARNWATKYYWSVLTSDNLATVATPINNSGDSSYTAATNISPLDGSLGWQWSIGNYPNGAPSGVVEMSNGNMHFVDSDIDTTTVGIDIGVIRSYNSLDSRLNGGFGRGWTFPLDMSVSFDAAGTLNATVLMADGRREFHGHNPDGSYATAFGYDNTFDYNSTTDEYTLTDSAKTKYRFKRIPSTSLVAVLSGITDADGNAITVSRAGSTTTVTDSASQRALTLHWQPVGTDGAAYEHIDQVTTAGAQAATWTYSYHGDNLYLACTPDVDPTTVDHKLCTEYGYPLSGGNVNKIETLYSPQDETGPAWAPLVRNFPKVRNTVHYDPTTGRAIDQVDGNGKAWTYTYVLPPVAVAVPMRDGSTTPGQFKTTATDPLGNARTFYFDGPRRLMYSKDETTVEGWFEYKPETGFLLKDTKRIATGTADSSFATTEYTVNAKGLNTMRKDPNGAVWQWTYNNSGQVLSEINPQGLITTHTYDADSTGAVNQGAHALTKAVPPVASPAPLYQWSLNDTSGSTAVASAGGVNGTYSTTGTVPNQPGAPKITQDPSVGFSGGQLMIGSGTTPNGVPFAGTGKTFALWFKTTSQGVLLSKTADPAGSATSAGHNPVLYVGTDGKLYAADWPVIQTVTPFTVNDGLWHRVVFSVSATDQTLYLDGNKIGTQSGTASETGWPYAYAYIGTGQTGGWAASSGGWMPFQGQIDDVTVYGTALTDADLFSKVQYGFTTATTPAYSGAAGHPPLWLLNKTTDQAGNVTTFEYDQGGDLRRSTDAAGLITDFTYDSIGRRTTEKISTDGGTTWLQTVGNTYDAANRLTRVDSPPVTNLITNEVHQLRTTNTWDDAGLLLSVTLSDVGGSVSPDASRTTSYHYDNAGRRDRVTDAAGKFTDTLYDAAGRPIETTDPRGTKVGSTFDGAGRELSVTLKAFVDDPYGVAPASTPHDVVTSTTHYDIAGRPDRTTDAKGRVTVTTYNVMGQPERVDLYKSEADRVAGTIWKVLTTTSYDVLGHPTQVSSSGHVVGSTPQMTQVVNNTYDIQGRMATTTKLNAASNGGTGTAAGGTNDETTTFTYDSLGNITKEVVTGGGISAETRTLFDVHNQPKAITVENGATDIVATSTRNKLGQPTSQTDARGQTVTSLYDSIGRLYKTTLPSTTKSVVDRTTGAVTSTTVAPFSLTGFNTFGEVVASQDLNGNVVKTTRDVLGRPTQIKQPSYTNPDAPVTTVTPSETFTYDSNGNVATRVDRRGKTTTFDYDMRNRVIRQTDPVVTGSTAGVSRTFYDNMGNVTKTINQMGAIVEAGYDELDRQISTTEHVIGIAGTTGDQLLVTTFSLDDAGRAITTTAPAPSGQQRLTTATYAPFGQQLTSTDANLKVTRYGYDGLGRQNKTIDPMNHRVETRYDQAGRADQTRAYGDDGTLLATTTQTLDLIGNPTQVDLPGGGKFNYAYDNLGRLTAATQLVSTTPTVKSITTSYGYDAAGNQTTLTDGRGKVWGTTYNTWNLPQDQIEPSTTGQTAITDRRYTTNYDATGLPLKDTLPGAVVVSRTYDELGRVKTESNPALSGQASTASVTFTYDKLGRVTSGSHPSGTVTLTYNERNQIKTVTAPNTGNSSFGYDQAGRMVQRVDSAGTVSYVWDQGDRLFRETDPLTTQQRTYNWRDDNQVDDVTYAATGGSSRDYVYDKFGRLQQDITKGSNATALRTVTYAYDPASTRLQTETVTPSGAAGVGTNTYAYDLAGRLKSWTGPTGTVTAYGWDDAGNRTTAGATTSTYDDRNRLVSTTAGETDTWTPRGTLKSKTVGSTTTNYTFDGLGRMTTGGTVTYTYDAFDRMASRQVGSTTTQSTYSGLGSQPSNDGSNKIARSPAGDPISLKVGTGTAQVVGQDSHGDLVQLLTPTATALTDTIDYTPFGDPSARTGTTANRLGYQGQWTDPTTKLVDMGARWYSPGWGRFISRDTHGGQLSTPVSLNRYTYANNDPIGMFDPDGFSAKKRGSGTTSHHQDADPIVRRAKSSYSSGSKGGGVADLSDLERTRKGASVYYNKNYINDLIAKKVNATYAQHNRDKDGWDASKDPFLKRLAHATVATNLSVFDTAADHVNPDGNIGKRDFEAVADNGGYADALQWAAKFLLADDKDVDQSAAQAAIAANPENIEDYGWKLYSWKKPQGFWDHVVDGVKDLAGPVVGALAAVGCFAAVGAAAVETGGAAVVVGGGTCAAAYGVASRAVDSAVHGGSASDVLYSALDPKSVVFDYGVGAATAGVLELATSGSSAVAPKSASVQSATNTVDDAVSITKPYQRPSGATTPAQRASVQGQPCVDCGTISPVQVADHKVPLVQEYYTTGTIDTTRMRALDAVQAQCPTCSAQQGAAMAQYSKMMKALFGLE